MPMNFKPKGFWLAFLVVSLICLLGRALDSSWIDYASKPLLMPMLMWYVWQHLRKNDTQGHPIAIWLQIALPFAWLGDVFLMIHKLHELMFILGLASFLVMQLLYIFIYTKIPAAGIEGALLFRRPYLGLPPLIIAFFFSTQIMGIPETPDTIRFAVPVYAAALSAMTLFALNRYKRVSDSSFYWTLYGSVLFLVSDLIIGVNQFIIPEYPMFTGLIPVLRVVIMATYIPAQVFIVRGLVRQIDDQSFRQIIKRTEQLKVQNQSIQQKYK